MRGCLAHQAARTMGARGVEATSAIAASTMSSVATRAILVDVVNAVDGEGAVMSTHDAERRAVLGDVHRDQSAQWVLPVRTQLREVLCGRSRTWVVDRSRALQAM
jgi:hypothetical protein